MTTQTARIAALEAHIEKLTATIAELQTALLSSIQAVATNSKHAHERLNAAGFAFQRLSAQFKREPFHVPPPITGRIPRAEFDAALKSLRDEDREHGGNTSYFPTEVVLRRAASLRSGVFDGA